MKKMFFMLVVMFVTITVKAQMVYDVNYGRMEFQVGNAWYSCADVPGATHISRGDNVMNVVNNYFVRLRHDDPEQYVREYNAWSMRGGLAGITPVRYSTATTGVGMMGGMMGGGMMGGMMVGTGMQNTGMVMGSMGMAGAQSNVVIDNSNLAETVGSGVTMSYDTGSNSLSVTGDPITAGLRLISAIGSKTRKNKTAKNGQVFQDANGNQFILKNGVLVPVRQQTTRTNTTTRTNGQVTYNVSAGGFVSGF